MELILASSSPRRNKLLREAGFVFRAINPGPVEEGIANLDGCAIHQARRLALAKALAVAQDLTNSLVLGADTLVSLNDQVIGKARDRRQARQILSALSGSDHQVITALALVHAPHGQRILRHQLTSLTMARLSQAQIDHYIDSGLWKGKAGAYAIQENDAFITGIVGSFSNVVGLPLELFEQMLRDFVTAQVLQELKA